MDSRLTPLQRALLDRFETAKRENPPLRVGSISVEAPEEILANKICTLLARSEIRDLVDAYVLERSGLSIEGALPLAHRKDGGVSPAQLAWVLSQIAIPDGSRIPGDTPPAELRTYLADLQRRLLTMAWPQPTP